MKMRVHEFLAAITPDAVGLDLLSLELLTVFQNFDLLPDVNADLDADDALTLATFAFCRWTLSWDFTPGTVAHLLNGAGVTTWAPSATSSPHELQPVGVVELRGGAHYALNYQTRNRNYPEFVAWLADTFVDMEKAMRVESIEIDKTRCKATALFNDGERYLWASPGGGVKFTKVERVKIENEPTATGGASPLCAVAGRLSGWVTPQPTDEATPRSEVRTLSLDGYIYKLKK